MKKSLSVLPILIILAVAGMIVWLVVVPNKGVSFSEFYILGFDGRATGYPKTLKEGDAGTGILGIVNREHEDEECCLLVQSDDVFINKIEHLLLANNKKMGAAG